MTIGEHSLSAVLVVLFGELETYTYGRTMDVIFFRTIDVTAHVCAIGDNILITTNLFAKMKPYLSLQSFEASKRGNRHWYCSYGIDDIDKVRDVIIVELAKLELMLA